MEFGTETIEVAAVPYSSIVQEPEDWTHHGLVTVGPSRCGNSACPDGCPRVSIAIGDSGSVISVRLLPEFAEQLADEIRLAAATIQAAGKVKQ